MDIWEHMGVGWFVLAKLGLHLTLAYQENVTDGFSKQKEWQETVQGITIEDLILHKKDSYR